MDKKDWDLLRIHINNIQSFTKISDILNKIP